MEGGGNKLATLAELVVKVGADMSTLSKGLSESSKTMNRWAKQAEGSIGPVMDKIGQVAKVAGLAVVTGFSAATVAGVKLNAELEQSKIAFTTLLGSAERADAFLRDMRDFANTTPFEFQELQSSAKRLLAFGFAAEQIRPMLTAVGDAVAGLGGGQEMIDRVTLALGQMQAKGKVSAQEMMQLAETGIPAWQMLADKMGVTTQEVMKLSEKGLIPAGAAIQALTEGMSDRFGGMMEKMSKTMMGLWSTMKDTAATVLTEITGPAFEMLRAKLEAVSKQIDEWRDNGSLQEWAEKAKESIAAFWAVAEKVFSALVGVAKWIIDNWGKIVPILAGVLAAFMAYKTAITIINGLQIASKALNAVLAMNPINLVVIAIGLLVAAGVALYKNFDTVRYYALQAWGALKVGVLKALEVIAGAYEKVWGWVPVLGEKITAAHAKVRAALEKEKNIMAERAEAYKAMDAPKVKAPEIDVPKIDATIPKVANLGATALAAGEKAAKGAQETKAAWEKAAESLQVDMEVIAAKTDVLAQSAVIAGDKIGELAAREKGLTTQIETQRQVVNTVQQAFGALKAQKTVNIEEADKLRVRLAQEQKALSDLEVELYNNKKAMEDVAQATAKQRQAFADLGSEIIKVRQKYEQDLAAVLEDYKNKVASVNAKLLEDEASVTKQYEQNLEQRAKALSNFTGLFDAFQPKEVSGRALLTNLQTQLDAMRTWSTNLNDLAARGIDQGLLGELRAAGPGAAGEIAALNKLSASELNQYVAIWKEKSNIARVQATAELENQRMETLTKIQDLRSQAAVELEKYRLEWEQKNQSIRKNTEDEINRIAEKYNQLVSDSTVKGQQFVLNFASGMESQFGVLMEKVMTMQGILGMQVPSTGSAGLRVPAMAEGGIVTRPTLTLIGEKHPEAVIPLEKMSGRSGETKIYINVTGANARDIWEELEPQIERAFVRAGVI
jgi:tape measure domain-containing protein